jgi:ketosteroid isomerase-like protein
MRLPAVALLAALICGPAAASPADEAAARSAVARLAKAFSEGDADTVVALASPELHLIHPTRGDMTYGDYTAAVRAGMKPRTDQVVTAELDHVAAFDGAVVLGITWRTTLTQPNGDILRRAERDQEVWRREDDGQWRLFRGASFPLPPR